MDEEGPLLLYLHRTGFIRLQGQAYVPEFIAYEYGVSPVVVDDVSSRGL